MDIQIDSREKARAIKKIIAEFDKQGVNHFVSKLYTGDYMSYDNPRLIIDRKQNLSEVYSNLCQGRKRFERELERAKNANIHLIFLIEHGNGIENISHVRTWENPRLKETPYAWDGDKLYRVMTLLSAKYGIEWKFCTKAETGKRIIDILSGCAK